MGPVISVFSAFVLFYSTVDEVWGYLIKDMWLRLILLAPAEVSIALFIY